MTPAIFPLETRVLLRAERSRQLARPGRHLLFAVLLPLGNLFFCGYVERHMMSGHNLPALQLFLTIECAVLALIAAVHFFSTVKEIVGKTRILPTPSIARAYFVAAAVFRDSISLGMLGTTAFGLAVMIRATPLLIPVLVSVVVLLGSGTQVLVGAALLVATDRSDRAAGVTLIGLLSLLAAMFWSMAFTGDTLPVAFPPVLWASMAIDSAGGGNAPEVIYHVLPLIALPILLLWASARWMDRS
jgi:hypothetical protein